MHTPQEILKFWFEELKPAQHWVKDAKLDETIKSRFFETHTAAARGELYAWRTTPQGRLAEIIVLDQFSRNIYRDQALSFASDGLALILAQEFVASGKILELAPVQRSFAIMPYMHSESLVIHDQSLKLFGDPEYQGSLEFEKKTSQYYFAFWSLSASQSNLKSQFYTGRD